jgi:hypothetical protein
MKKKERQELLVDIYDYIQWTLKVAEKAIVTSERGKYPQIIYDYNCALVELAKDFEGFPGFYALIDYLARIRDDIQYLKDYRNRSDLLRRKDLLMNSVRAAQGILLGIRLANWAIHEAR